MIQRATIDVTALQEHLADRGIVPATQNEYIKIFDSLDATKEQLAANLVSIKNNSREDTTKLAAIKEILDLRGDKVKSNEPVQKNFVVVIQGGSGDDPNQIFSPSAHR